MKEELNQEKINSSQLSVEKKLENLCAILKDIGKVVIAFSGGVDSTLLLKVAVKTLGAANVLAVTSCAETYPQQEQKLAEELAAELGVDHHLIYTEELKNDDFTQNDRYRCYYCKYELFSEIKELAAKRGFEQVVDGSNFDDRVNDYRPGMKAARELQVRSPLMEAELNKKEIRILSRSFDLPTWDKPSFACLSSRFPYGEEITADKLEKVAAAEKRLRAIIDGQLRLRYHDSHTARIEVSPEDFETVMGKRAELIKAFKELGFTYITLDLEGYRTGSMNEVLENKEED